MIKLVIAQVLFLHNLMCRETGGSSVLRDKGALESAIYHAFASFEGKDLYPSIEEKVRDKLTGSSEITLFLMVINVLVYLSCSFF